MRLYCVCRYKLKNIEETEAAKKLLQEKRLMGRTKSDFSIPSSYSADYFQRGRDYAEKLRRGNIFFDDFIIDYICIFTRLLLEYYVIVSLDLVINDFIL